MKNPPFARVECAGLFSTPAQARDPIFAGAETMNQFYRKSIVLTLKSNFLYY
jgi:hypothetical protein